MKIVRLHRGGNKMKYKILKKDPMFQNDKDIFQLGKRDGNTKRNFLFYPNGLENIWNATHQILRKLSQN